MRRTYIMAKLMKTIAPIDSLSGMFGKREHSLSGKAVIANVRKRGGAWNDSQPYMYFSVLTKSTYATNVTQKMLDNQNRFRAVAESTLARLADPEQMPLDQMAFKNQTKYKTLRQYVWHKEMEEYDQSNQ